MLQLKHYLKERGIAQGQLATAIGMSQPTVSAIVNHDDWPKEPSKKDLKRMIAQAIFAQTGEEPGTEIFQEVDESARQPKRPKEKNQPNEVSLMLLRRSYLNQDARKAFRLMRDPFRNEIQEAADVFLSPELLYVFESMWQALQTRQTDFLAIVGESGSGKTTLRDELLDRIRREQHKVHVIEPAGIAGMEANDNTGKTLKAASIAQAIISTVAPSEKICQSQEALYRQVKRVLVESSRAGFRHALVIDEAHCLPTATLKHLKRFYEFKDGHQTLMSIILIGQPELARRLDERNPEVREVTQRCWLAHLEPLDTSLEGYVQHKFTRIGRNASDFLEADAYPAIREALLFRRAGKGATGHISYLYPLAVNNLLTEALNYVAKIGGGMKVDAGVIKGVREEM